MNYFIKYYEKSRIIESEAAMRKRYIYAITLIILSVSIWAGYYLYLEYRPVSYQNGTFVEVPESMMEEEKELSV